jgi:hypothetical protein
MTIKRVKAMVGLLNHACHLIFYWINKINKDPISHQLELKLQAS